jgi:tRNA (guanosine-2'-O-)-methyltransferase
MTKARHHRITTVMQQRQTDACVLMEKVHKLHNLAAVIRTCDAVGVDQLHAVLADGEYRRHPHVASGANSWIHTHLHEDITTAITELKAQGKTIYAAHLSDDAVDFKSVDYTKPCAILLGTEKFGISDEAAELADQHIMIPMRGMVESLNVSVAAALILYELERQRTEAGLYNKSSYTPQDIERVAREKMHPRMVRHCKANNIELPKLDKEGNLELNKKQ